MVSKKEEHDAMEKLSEKDLWCKDLDDFVDEWEVQLKEEEDYQKSIRNTNRRASRKIGAGKNAVKGRPKAAADKEYNPKPLKANPAKGVIKVEKTSHQGFLNMFAGKPKPKTSGLGSDGADEGEFVEVSSDEDFGALKKAVEPATTETSRAPSEQPVNGRTKRAAAAAPKKWIISDEEDEESDGGSLLGNIGAMVKGIGATDKSDGASANERVSLFAMSASRPGSSHGRAASTDLPKLKSKPSRTFDYSDDAADETNYEMLAKSSPAKAAPVNLDSYISDDDDDIIPMARVTKKIPVKPAAAKSAPKAAAVPKPKKAPASKKAAEPAPAKPTQLSPAAKAYAAKQTKMKLTSKNAFSEDEDEDIEMDDSPPPKPVARAPAAKTTKAKPTAKKASSEDEDEDLEMDDSPPPKPAARGRPARAAAVPKAKKPVYIDNSDGDELDDGAEDESALVEEESEEEDDFDESD